MTHSLLGGTGLALLGALLLWGLFRAHAYWRLIGLTYLGVVLHIGMDYLTSYGTQVFWPLAAGHYTADAVCILAYFYTGLMVVALLLIRMVRQTLCQRGEWQDRMLVETVLSMLTLVISRRSCIACGRLATPGSRSPWRPSMCWSSGMASRPMGQAACPSRWLSFVCKRLTPLVMEASINNSLSSGVGKGQFWYTLNRRVVRGFPIKAPRGHMCLERGLSGRDCRSANRTPALGMPPCSGGTV